MGRLPRFAQFYIGSLAVLAVYANALALPQVDWTQEFVLSLAVFTAAACVAQLLRLTLPGVRAQFSVATAIMIAIAILYGAAAVLLSSLVSTAVSHFILRRPLSRVIFNASQLSLTYGFAATVYHLLWSGPPLENYWPAIPAALALGAVYFVVNTGCVFLIVSLVDRTPFFNIWRLSARRIIIHDVAMVAVGLVLSIVWTYNRWTIPLVLPLLVVLYHSMSAVGKMERETKEALLALARLIDRRDYRTFAHSERVAEFVSWICAELRLSGDDMETIIYAARLHDLGKVGVPDGLLLKPGKLTPDEEAQFRRHPDIGADVIAQFPIFREGTDIVRFEHEWYNGAGYPRGLAGEAIPLGSRIIAVADAYEAMTADRPYRKAMSQEAPVELLRQCSGSQFDPIAVTAFIEALRKHQLAVAPALASLSPAAPGA